ncbi:MAG: hypothetical protein ACPL1H_10100, partial [bacterium]
MDSSNITGYCLTGSTSATCEKPIGQYITPPGTHSIDIHRCFSNNGPCCSVSSSFNPKNAIGKFAHSFNPTIHLRYKDFL